MSAEARQTLVDSGHLIFQDEHDDTADPTQRADFLDPRYTNTNLIAFTAALIAKGYHVEITAVNRDHSDDSALGYHCHHNGFAWDGWPLTGPIPGEYLDQSDPVFARFLGDATSCAFYLKTGLAGEAATPENFAAAGAAVFHDDGADHVHFEVNG